MLLNNFKYFDPIIYTMYKINFKKNTFRGVVPKDSFQRALRKVAPEMELFLENQGQYIKHFVKKLVYTQSCTFRHFTKKLYLEKYV